jgi:hypothetical protein
VTTTGIRQGKAGFMRPHASYMSSSFMSHRNLLDLGLKDLPELVRAPTSAATPAPALASALALTAAPALAPASAPDLLRCVLSPFSLVKFGEFWQMKMVIVRLNS